MKAVPQKRCSICKKSRPTYLYESHFTQCRIDHRTALAKSMSQAYYLVGECVPRISRTEYEKKERE